MVAQHNLPVNARDGDAVRTVAAGLSVFRIGNDGKLAFARGYEVDVGDKLMFWMGEQLGAGNTMISTRVLPVMLLS